MASETDELRPERREGAVVIDDVHEQAFRLGDHEDDERHDDYDEETEARRQRLIRWGVDLTVLTTCVVFVVLRSTAPSFQYPGVIGFAIIFGLRAVAIHRHLEMPDWLTQRDESSA